MGTLEQRRVTFDQVAELYDRLRPGYPDQLVEDVVMLSGIPELGRILEIGCGPGKATLPFARRNYRMTCLEPGQKLARIASGHLDAFADVRIEVIGFEDWAPEDGAFDLVIAAQSFHFIEPTLGIGKVARVLREGGAFAVFGNQALDGDSEVHQRVQQAYARHAPGLGVRSDQARLEDLIDANGHFGTVFMARYRWHATYGADDYVGLMETQSDHRLLPNTERAALLHAIHAAISTLGGSIRIDYETRLHFARRTNP
jgi:SAM-dependent methyltransferase